MTSPLTRHDAVRLLLEGVVVVVSIVLAFLLDAWWDDQELANRLEQDLTSVSQELVANRELLLYDIDALRRIAEGGDAMVQIMESNPEAASVSVSDTLAFLTNDWEPVLNLSFGAVDALIASGRFGEIEDATLRRGLAGLRDLVADAVEEEVSAAEIYRLDLFPLVRGRLRLNTRVADEFHSAPRQVGRVIPSYGTLEYPNGLAIQNTIRIRSSYYRSSLSQMRPLIPHIDDLLQRISALQ